MTLRWRRGGEEGETDSSCLRLSKSQNEQGGQRTNPLQVLVPTCHLLG